MSPDLDRDGDSDLVLASSDSEGDGVRVLLGDGAGSFQLLGEDPGYEWPPLTALATPDLDGDGQPDLVGVDCTTPKTGQRLSTYRSRGDGTFDELPAMPIGMGTLCPMVSTLRTTGDADGVLVIRGSEVRVLWPAGEGTLRETLAIRSPGQLSSVAVGDLDEDGADDFVVRDEDAHYRLRCRVRWSFRPQLAHSLRYRPRVQVVRRGTLTETGTWTSSSRVTSCATMARGRSSLR